MNEWRRIAERNDRECEEAKRERDEARAALAAARALCGEAAEYIPTWQHKTSETRPCPACDIIARLRAEAAKGRT